MHIKGKKTDQRQISLYEYSPISLRSMASGSVGGRSYTPRTSVLQIMI